MPSMATIELFGTAGGETIINTFAYYADEDVPEADAQNWQDVFTEAWVNQVSAPLVLGHSDNYLGQQVQGRLWGGLGGALTFQPTELSPEESEGAMVGSSAGMVPSVIVSFDLSPIPYYAGLPVDIMPRRGYIAVSPVTEDLITDDNRLDISSPNLGLLQAARDACLVTIQNQVVLPTQWVPARVRRVNGDPVGASYISGAALRQVVSTRRSRKPRI